jgi:hypothetical protein
LLTLLTRTQGGFDVQWFTTLLAMGEIGRRCMWNVFRVANEQANNQGEYRACECWCACVRLTVHCSQLRASADSQ